MTEQYKIYNQIFETTVDKIENQLNFNEIYEAETGYKLNKARQGACPFCGSGTGSHKSSDGAFTFYPSINIGKCYSCGAGSGIVKLVMHQHNCQYKEAIQYIAHQYLNTELIEPGVETHCNVSKMKPKAKIKLSERKKISEAEQKAEEEDKKQKFEWIKEKILGQKDLTQAGDYLVNRGLVLEKLPDNSYYQAAPYDNLPAGIVFFDTEMRCLNKRYFTDDLPEGIKKAFTFGQMLNSFFDKTYRTDSDKIYITEGVINALSLYQCEKSAIALFATTNYIDDVKKFKNYFNEKHVIIAFDADKAGQQSAIKQANFILGNFNILSISIIVFPDNADANDLLQDGGLQSYVDNKYNYFYLDKETISHHLKQIASDQKNYHPKLLLNNYYNRPAAKEEKNGTFKAEKAETVPEEVLKLFRGTHLLKNETFKKYDIQYIEEYTAIENRVAHVHKSIEGLPIFRISLGGKSVIIWRPFSKKPYNEFEFRAIKKEDLQPLGFHEIEKEFNKLSGRDEEEKKPKTGDLQLEKVIITYNLVEFLNLAAIDEYPVYNFNDKYDYGEIEELSGWAKTIYQLTSNDKKCQAKARKTGLKFIEICTMHVPQLNGVAIPSIKEFLTHYSEPRLFKKQLNTALPFKFWEFEKGDYDINIIKLRHFLEANGYYTYPALQEKQGYMYIKVEGRIVKRMEKDTFPRHIETFIDGYLRNRGESVKLRNKVTISSRFSESNLSGIKEVQLDFQNSAKDFQNWFFEDGNMWTVTLKGIHLHSQKSLKKYIWEDEVLKFPSKKTGSPFKIFFQEGYLKELEELRAMDKHDELYYHKKVSVAGMKPTEKYDIEILDRNNYFLQFLFLTSHVYYEKVEAKGIEIKPTDFWYNLEGILTHDEIMEIKLHLINKLTWLGYFMKDYKSMSDDYGLAILDAINNEDGLKRKGAAGGGKSIITKAIKQVKRTLILKAEKEDWCEDKHRYENYSGERVVVADDMHLKSKIGNMLTDFSEGIEVNPKHKRPRKIPFTESPKIIVTRNYIDDEGERVDRRLGRMFVFPFFHDTKGGRHKIRRRPSDYFGRMLFQDDNEEQKSQLVNLFAYCYMANLKFGEINPPMLDMEKFRLIKRIGEPLIEYLDLYLEDPHNFGYVDRVPLYANFKETMRSTMSGYQRTNIYSTSQKFKALVEYYCELRDYVFNPEDKINDTSRTRIMRQSETQVNKHGHAISTEHFYIAPKETELPDDNTGNEPVEVQTIQQQAFDFDGGDDLPF